MRPAAMPPDRVGRVGVHGTGPGFVELSVWLMGGYPSAGLCDERMGA